MFGDGTKDLPLFALPPEKPRNPFVHGSQNWRVLEALKEGPKACHELLKIAPKYTGRISNVRAKLAGTGWTIKPPRQGHPEEPYELVRS
jgi:hypothetical protein